MLVIEAGLWTLKRLCRTPVAWLAFLLSLALWPLIVVFSPLTMTMTPSAAGQLVVESSWSASLLTMLVALGPLSRNAWLLAQGPQLRSQVICGSALLATGLVGMVGGMAGAATFGGPLGLPWMMIGVTAILSLVHLTLLALWILRLPVSLIWRSLSLVLFAWALPALTAGHGMLGSRLAMVFGTQHRIEALQDLTLNGWLEQLIPIGVLALLVVLSPLPRVRLIPDRS